MAIFKNCNLLRKLETLTIFLFFLEIKSEYFNIEKLLCVAIMMFNNNIQYLATTVIIFYKQKSRLNFFVLLLKSNQNSFV